MNECPSCGRRLPPSRRHDNGTPGRIVLRYLREHEQDGMVHRSGYQIAKDMRMNRAQACRVLSRLESDGIIRWQRGSPNQKRRKSVIQLIEECA